jgi:hypothetical protein
MSMVAIGSGVAAIAVAFGGNGWGLAMLRIDEGLDAATARLLFDEGNITFASFWVPLAGMLLASSVVALRDGAFPKWFGWYGLAVAIALLVSRAFWTAGGVAFTGYVFFWLWLIIASVFLIRRA